MLALKIKSWCLKELKILLFKLCLAPLLTSKDQLGLETLIVALYQWELSSTSANSQEKLIQWNNKLEQNFIMFHFGHFSNNVWKNFHLYLD